MAYADKMLWTKSLSKAAGYRTWVTDLEELLMKTWAQSEPLLWRSHPIQESRNSSLQPSISVCFLSKCTNDSSIPSLRSPLFSPLTTTWRAPYWPSDCWSQLPTGNAERQHRKSQVLVNSNPLTHLGIFHHITRMKLTVAMARPTRTTPKSLGSRNLLPYR